MNSLDERLDAQASVEVEWLRSTPSDGVKVSRGFDRLQVVEAKLVARRNAEQAVWPMIRACLDPAESLTARAVIGREEMQLIESFLAEGEGASSSINFEVVLHLPPCRNPIRFDRAGGAVRETDERPADIVDFDAPPAASAIRTFLDYRDAIAQDPGDRSSRWTQQEFGRGQCVAANVN